jgi:osmotically-inducible protein OsmY
VNFIMNCAMSTSRRSLLTGLLLLAISQILTGCITVAAVGAASVTSVDVVHDRRTLGEYFDDSSIELQMKKYVIADENLRDQSHTSSVSVNGILLLTGEVPNEQVKQQITTYANTIEGVRQVVDEMRIAGKTAIMSRTNDTWLTAKVKSLLIKDMYADANRIKVLSEYGNVYLMGLVTAAEADQATNVASSVRGVVRVVKVFEYTDQ